MAPASRLRDLLRPLLVTPLLGCLLAAAPAAADSPPAPPAPPPFSLAVTPAYQFDTSLNSGGNVSVSRVFVDGSGEMPVSETLGVGFHAAYDYADYHFSGPALIGGLSPWDKIHRLEVGGSVSYDLTPEWSLLIAPSVQLSRADDAGWGNALVYGGVVSVSRDIGKNLTLGLGVGAFSELEEVTVFPMIVVNWQITDRLLLANPFRPGPTGPAGMELAYRVGDGWDLGAGAAYRSSRFRLSRSGLFDDSIGQSSSLPTWVRLTRKMGATVSIDCYAGVMVGNELSIDDRDGNRVASTRADPAPFLALALSARF